MVIIQCTLPLLFQTRSCLWIVTLVIYEGVSELSVDRRYPCTDSNCALRLRRPTLCPLSYRGGRRNFIIKQGRPFKIAAACFYAGGAPLLTLLPAVHSA